MWIAFLIRFFRKICYYSDSNPQEIRKENIYGDTFNKFISNKMTEILSIHPCAQFIFYNPKIAYSINVNAPYPVPFLSFEKLR